MIIFLFFSTVKVVLIPVGQETIIFFKVDTILKYLVDHFSRLLAIPASELQIHCAGKFEGKEFIKSSLVLMVKQHL